MRFDDNTLAPYSGNEPFIFLSYSHKDKNEAEDLIRKLNENNYRIWYDEGITAGKEWTANIAERIEQCGYFFALISHNYVLSTQCKKEMLYAVQKARSVLPIYIENIELPRDMAFQLIAIRAVYKDNYLSNLENYYKNIFAANGLEICQQTSTHTNIEDAYLNACELLNNALKDKRLADFNQAKQKFERLNGYKDSATKIKDCDLCISRIIKQRIITIISTAVIICFAGFFFAFKDKIFRNNPTETIISLNSDGNQQEPVSLGQGIKVYSESDAVIPSNETQRRIVVQVSAGGRHTMVLHPDGTLSSIGDNGEKQRNVDSWADVKKVCAGQLNTVALKVDGTVSATGNNQFGQCDVNDWKDIVDIDTEQYHTIGLRSNGCVIATGFKDRGACDVDQWNNIKEVSAGEYHSLGLTQDGHVVAAGDNRFHECDTTDWNDITAIDAGYNHSIALKENGSVLATGKNDKGQCNVSEWKNIIQISAGGEHSVALCEDGTVLAVGNNDFGQCNVKEWRDIVAVSAGYYHTVGVMADGTIVATGWDKYGQCDTEKLSD